MELQTWLATRLEKTGPIKQLINVAKLKEVYMKEVYIVYQPKMLNA